MPGGDRTGPLGMGPFTGRGAGYCRGFGMPGYANRWAGGGWGAGRGGGFGRRGYGRDWYGGAFAGGFPGRGWGRAVSRVTPQYYNETPGPSANQERRYLEEQAEFLRNELQEIDRRLAELKTDKGA
jgi:hypothetical protein